MRNNTEYVSTDYETDPDCCFGCQFILRVSSFQYRTVNGPVYILELVYMMSRRDSALHARVYRAVVVCVLLLIVLLAVDR